MYSNREAVEFLKKKGFIEGLKLNYTGPRMPADMPNLKSVENNKSVAFEKKIVNHYNGISHPPGRVGRR